MYKKMVVGLFVLLPSLAFAEFSNNYRTHLDDDLRHYCNRQTAYSTGVSDARKGLTRKEDFARICSINRETYNAAYNTGYNYGLTNQGGLIVNEPAPAHPEVQTQIPSAAAQPYTRAIVPGTYSYGGGGGGGDGGYLLPGGAIISSSTNAVGASSEDSRASSSPVYPGEQNVPSGDFARPEPTQGLQSLIEVSPSAHGKCIETSTGQACGFNCVNSMNNVRCAATPDQICRSNEIGHIGCGYHCISTSKMVRCAAFPTDQCVADLNGYVFCGQSCRITGNATAVCDVERYAP